MDDRVVDRPVAAIQRSHGRAMVDVRATPRGTALADLYQHANAKIRLPKTYETSLQAVLVNTAGGIAGGDTLQWRARVRAAARLVVSTQACERIYGHAKQAAHITNTVEVADGGFCAWLPQETIIYDGAMLQRSLSVDLEANASFLGLESLVLGRAHMGEQLRSFALCDAWLVRRCGVPLYADVLRLNGETDKAASIAGLAGMTVLVTLVYVPKPDGVPLAAMRDRIAALEPPGGVVVGASAFESHLVCRIVAPSSYALRQALPGLLAALEAEISLPKIWRF